MQVQRILCEREYKEEIQMVLRAVYVVVVVMVSVGLGLIVVVLAPSLIQVEVGIVYRPSFALRFTMKYLVYPFQTQRPKMDQTASVKGEKK